MLSQFAEVKILYWQNQDSCDDYHATPMQEARRMADLELGFSDQTPTQTFCRGENFHRALAS
ncbi:MAG: hypothetical protein ACI8P9_001683 [Parasphingorhabdus sp.]|jgi:hypothetical protein